jgi:hypothetical protein
MQLKLLNGENEYAKCRSFIVAYLMYQTMKILFDYEIENPE